MAGKGKRDGATIVIKKYEEGGHGHHGGAWKVAYADFVTAMMAFFLLMWLLNATSEEQRRGLADYFSPTNVLGRSTTGSGQPFGGTSPNSEGQMATDTGAVRVERGPAPMRIDIDEEEGDMPNSPGPNDATGEAALPGEAGRGPNETSAPAPQGPASTDGQLGGSRPEGMTDAEFRAEQARREAEAFDQATEQLRAAVRDDPALADLARQLRVEQVPEGLRIQLLDADRQPMFQLGGATPNDRARALIQRVAQITARLPNALSISGHTDATPFRGTGERSNWELSAERANSVRRILVDGGIAEGRLRSVTGNADRDPLIADQPTAAANRRVAITLLRQVPTPHDHHRRPRLPAGLRVRRLHHRRRQVRHHPALAAA